MVFFLNILISELSKYTYFIYFCIFNIITPIFSVTLIILQKSL